MQLTLNSTLIKRRSLLITELGVLCSMALFLLNGYPFLKALKRSPRYASAASIPYGATAIDDHYPSVPMTQRLWSDLRKGLHYLETSGKELPPDFVHPGGVAFGELGLSKIAIQDVMNRYPAFSDINPEEVFKDRLQYERFAMYYADLLLRRYLGLIYWEMAESEVFDALQKAWFLGPTLYQAGRPVIPSREIKAQEFMRTLS